MMMFEKGKDEERGEKEIKDEEEKRIDDLKKEMGSVMKQMEIKVVREGEGERKMVEVEVKGEKYEE